MYVTLRVPSVAVAVDPPLPPLYVGTVLKDAVTAALNGSKEWGTALYLAVDGDSILILTAPHRRREPDPTWHDKASEADYAKAIAPPPETQTAPT